MLPARYWSHHHRSRHPRLSLSNPLILQQTHMMWNRSSKLRSSPPACCLSHHHRFRHPRSRPSPSSILQQRHGQWASPLSLDKAPVSLAVFQEWQPTPASAWSLSNSCLLHRDRTQLLRSRVGRALPPKSPATNCYSGHSQSSNPPLPPHKFSRCHPTQILRTLVLLTLFNLFHLTPSGRIGTGKSGWDA